MWHDHWEGAWALMGCHRQMTHPCHSIYAMMGCMLMGRVLYLYRVLAVHA
jgi:hypothetical protein